MGDELAFCNLSESFIQAGQKLGFLLEFRTRKFWQLALRRTPEGLFQA